MSATTKPAPASGARLLTIPEVAEQLAALGVKWSERTIRRHLVAVSEWGGISTGDVPCLPLGAHPRVPAWWLREIASAIDALGSPGDKSDNTDNTDGDGT